MPQPPGCLFPLPLMCDCQQRGSENSHAGRDLFGRQLVGMHALSVPPKVIASRLGHADTQVLFEHYVKEFEAQDREAAVALEDALRQARGTRMGHAEADA
jgi:hypothetical protein